MIGVYALDGLAKCLAYTEVNPMLDILGVEQDVERRIRVLCEYMAIEKSFACTVDDTEFTPEEIFSLLCQQLASLNRRREAKVAQ